MTKKIGIIGGSGLYNPDFFTEAEDLNIKTPWGSPSSPLRCGQIDGVEVVLLARHGREHTIPPTQVNNRANIKALQSVGCTHLIVSTAVGSLREEIGRGDLVVPDQFIDFTRRRALSFHEEFLPHSPQHLSLPDPFDSRLRQIFIEEIKNLGYAHHPKGTVITIEGPRFSTRAESRMYRILGADIVNMSVAPEAMLAGEAGLPYAAVAMATDYDAWKDNEAPVTWDEILSYMAQNVCRVVNLFQRVIPRINQLDD